MKRFAPMRREPCGHFSDCAKNNKVNLTAFEQVCFPLHFHEPPMKYVLIIPDGCADEPQAFLGGRTPLEAANVPHMDAIAREGLVGRALTVPAELPAGSDVGTMSLFGYDPLVYHTGRAPLEAAAQGIDLGPEDWAIRCNLVTIRDGLMESFTAHQVSNLVGAECIEVLQRDQCGSPTLKFHAGVSYRNLLIFRARDQQAPFSKETASVPPHDITGQLIEGFLPSGPGSELLRQLMARSETLFAEAQNLESRRSAGRQVPTGIWLWGLGKRPAMVPFVERFGKTAAVITAVDLLRGIGRLLGWKVVEVPGATGYTDTDYAAKGHHAIDTLSSTDFVVVHVEATDEASHEGDVVAKVKALEEIDRHIVGPLHAYLKTQGEYRILVSPDHPTFLRTKTHSHGEVPFTLAGTGIQPDANQTYSETTAQHAAKCLPGHQLMPLLFG
jgi:2,3-bisphosphoglycerate-independent phosphoglycerate mutase